MKSLTVKKIKRIVFIIVFLIFAYIVAANFIFAANIGYLVDDNHNSTTVPTDETYLAAFETDQINWEIAYWSAVISEYTYEKPYYPLNNLALKNLGFTTLREYSYYEIEGELEDSLMVDVGIKDVFSDDGSSFKLVAIAFRGSVPIALDDPTTIENMRQNINILSEQWKTK
ncbi:MAG: hypothetical protein LBR68_00190, partial [Lachnoclostridium sp.]|nr:hypothetical protein [Lachnoclostridium sp.]